MRLVASQRHFGLDQPSRNQASLVRVFLYLELVTEGPSTQQLEARIADLEKRLDAAVAALENLLRAPTRGADVKRELDKAKQKTWHSRVW